VVLLAPQPGAAELKQEYYLGGKALKREEHLVNGKREGLTRIYYRNGKIKLEVNFKNGVPDGIARRFYKDGNLHTQWHFRDGVPDGEAKLYLPNGNLLHVRHYTNGRLDYIDNYKEGGQQVDRKFFSDDEQRGAAVIFPPLRAD
jgi:antitoxin component YwqK of YwqJK toxin-antitoxin module